MTTLALNRQPSMAWLGTLTRSREFSVFLALAILIAATVAANPRFLSAQSTKDLLLNSSILVILAVGQAIVIVTKNVDLSVGSVLGLTAFATGKIFVVLPDLPVIAMLAIGIGLGALLGAVNGALIAVAKVPSLVVTLGTLYIFRGVDFAWAQGQQISPSNLPEAFLALGSGAVLGLPYLALIALVVVIAFGLYLRNYRSGREFYAIGSDVMAARLYGIGVGRKVFAAFAISGALAGLAGVIYAAKYGNLDATAGQGLELNVVAAAVVGGVAIAGGVGTVYGAAIGAVLLTTITSALPVLGVSPFWQRAMIGALILASIALDRYLALRTERRLRGHDKHAG
ncbi:ABC transporter permease [Arthrobacter sp. ISL-72]|uniref:ABC transporter permease n=1 Tax=Arthrobacter sp. ISL-72 TaxID=2819114 RepID=UPI001BEC0AB7|nr:ABC transporter permease [Arthrobacter sp. ISL-72]MBT2597082.1 ABC transporter permease [Arthrobacter sp. ISL-72]